MESSTCGPISRVRAVGGEWRETPPAAVIYHGMPCRRAVHTYTTMMIHGGGKAGRRLSLVLIDVIDIGIRRRADYSAVNNSTPLAAAYRHPPLPTPIVRVLPSRGTTTATLLPPPLRKHHLSPFLPSASFYPTALFIPIPPHLYSFEPTPDASQSPPPTIGRQNSRHTPPFALCSGPSRTLQLVTPSLYSATAPGLSSNHPLFTLIHGLIRLHQGVSRSLTRKFYAFTLPY